MDEKGFSIGRKPVIKIQVGKGKTSSRLGNSSDMNRYTRTRYLFYGFNIAIPLLCGLYLYLALRPDAYVSIFISKFIPLPIFPSSSFQRGIVAVLQNFASDMLWAYSLGFAVMLVLGYSRKNLFSAALLCVGFEVLLEVLQKAGLFHGTFDFLDILLEAITVCLALIHIKMFEEAQNEKSSKNS